MPVSQCPGKPQKNQMGVVSFTVIVKLFAFYAEIRQPTQRGYVRRAHIGSGRRGKGTTEEPRVINWLTWFGKGGLHDRVGWREKDEFNLAAHGGRQGARVEGETVVAHSDGLEASRRRGRCGARRSGGGRRR